MSQRDALIAAKQHIEIEALTGGELLEVENPENP